MAYLRRSYENPLLSKTWVFLQAACCFKKLFPCAGRGSGGGEGASTDPSWWWGSQDASGWYRWGQELWGQMSTLTPCQGLPASGFTHCVCCLCCFKCHRRLFGFAPFWLPYLISSSLSLLNKPCPVSHSSCLQPFPLQSDWHLCSFQTPVWFSSQCLF